VYINRALGVFCHHEQQNTEVNSEATEKEAQKIRQRHEMFGSLLDTARNVLAQKKAYDGKDMPRSSDEIG
jgi:hypothetical protein